MSYRCEICAQVRPPGQPRLLHRVHRLDGSIQKELPVCADCHRLLESGRQLAEVIAGRGQLSPRSIHVASPLPDGGEPSPPPEMFQPYHRSK